MQSAHKLVAALAALVALLVAAYFIFTALQSSGGGQPASVAVSSELAPTTQPIGTSEAANSANSATSQSSVVRTLDVKSALLEQASTRTDVSETLIPKSAVQLPSTRVVTSTSTTEAPTSTEAPISLSEGPANVSELPISTPADAQSQSQSQVTTEILLGSSTSEAPLTPAPELAGESKPAKETSSTPNPASFEPTTSSDERRAWEEFKKQFNKNYTSSEEERNRADIFANNLRFINSYNRQSQALFQLGLNQFADKTRDEINAVYLGPQVNWTGLLDRSATLPPPMRILADQEVQPGNGDALLSVDWRNLTTGAAPPDQATCRESSLFAIVASLEVSLNAISGGTRVKLSEQQLLDCLAAVQIPGEPPLPPPCSGQLSMTKVLDFLQHNAVRLVQFNEYIDFKNAQMQGIAPPNICVPPMPAGFARDPRPRVGSYSQVHKDNFDEALLNRGPLVVALDASQPTFHFYKSGLYHELNCSPDTYNMHALLVGLAAATPDGDTTQAHYTLRASLGAHWGEQGHMRLLKDGARNRCLPQHLATYPNVAFE